MKLSCWLLNLPSMLSRVSVSRYDVTSLKSESYAVTCWIPKLTLSNMRNHLHFLWTKLRRKNWLFLWVWDCRVKISAPSGHSLKHPWYFSSSPLRPPEVKSYLGLGFEVPGVPTIYNEMPKLFPQLIENFVGKVIIEWLKHLLFNFSQKLGPMGWKLLTGVYRRCRNCCWLLQE